MSYKGFKFSEESKRKMSASAKGKIISDKTRKKLSLLNKGSNNAFYGKKHSQETRKKISLKMKGKKGQKHSEETKLKMSLAQKGSKGSNWQGGKTEASISIRNSLEYKLVRRACFERDDYTCVWCKQKGGVLNADHIKPFAHYPELRFALDNLRTLCKDCHKTTDTYGWKLFNNKYLKHG